MDIEHYLTQFREYAKAAGFQESNICEMKPTPILGFTKKSANKPKIYVSSGIHGDEPAGPYALLKLLKNGFFSPHFEWRICPALNPTGLSTDTRENIDKVDLNRDYLSQRSLEISAHTKWLTQQPTPDVFLSLHEDWESTGFYFYEISLRNCTHITKIILNAAESVLPIESELVIDDHNVTLPGWIYHSMEPDMPKHWPEAIYLSKQGCPISYTFETPSSSALETRIACHCAVMNAVIDQLQSSKK